MSFIHAVQDTLYGGINASIDGVGGAECARHIPRWVKICEEIIVLIYLFVLYAWTARTLSRVSDDDVRAMGERERRIGSFSRRFVLMVLAMVLGMELSYKLVTRQLLFVMNPCHVVTITQLYLLCVVPSKMSVAVFRTMIHNLFGTFLGVLFAVTNTRELPGEVSVYWVQHVLICLVPFFIIYLWGPQSLEPLLDWSWTRVALVVFIQYHHHVLLPLAELTYVNLNSMLCPPCSDPIGGPYYRAIHLVLMSILVLTFGKLYSAISCWAISHTSPNSKDE
ncbi:transmembrane protein 164-like [Corticium candelabrum]|uniref:transmembrane protein 164-like n=1 Tax=Corticium candelabrum TaxID=121492 RepID=UPI002E25EF95|nr:transmembrane protein 164-like [Corticium candelabrum]